MAKCRECGKTYSVWTAELGAEICNDCLLAQREAHPQQESPTPPVLTSGTAMNQGPAYRKCPYCAEQILPEAKKCKHCGEFLNSSLQDTRTVPRKSGRKPLGTTFIMVGLLCVGIGLINTTKGSDEEMYEGIVSSTKHNLGEMRELNRLAGGRFQGSEESIQNDLSNHSSSLESIQNARFARIMWFCLCGGVLFVLGLVLRAQ